MGVKPVGDGAGGGGVGLVRPQPDSTGPGLDFQPLQWLKAPHSAWHCDPNPPDLRAPGSLNLEPNYKIRLLKCDPRCAPHSVNRTGSRRKGPASLIRLQVNSPGWQRSRAAAIKNGIGLRFLMQNETQQYDITLGAKEQRQHRLALIRWFHRQVLSAEFGQNMQKSYRCTESLFIIGSCIL